LPAIREVRKERVILADQEIERFLGEPSVDLELRVLSLTARTEGGMRTGDLNAWDWTMLDLVHFEQCTPPRAKTGTPQVLAIPPVLRPILRAWWVEHGSPTSGPVFPSRRGKRKGDFKGKRGASYARRLRLALLRAGVRRHDCTRPPDAAPVARDEACCGAMARDPLFSETATTRPVDFHSFRRAFASALAEADVTVQRAMHLAGHSDARRTCAT